MSKTSDLERTAYHEAGHAVVWLELCKKWTGWSSIADVHVIAQDSDSGGVTFENGNLGVDMTEYDQLKDSLNFYFAGFAAERKCDPEFDSRFTRWNCRADDEIALLTFALQKSAGWSQGFVKERQHSLVSCAELEFHALSCEARKECQRMIDDNWESIDRLARCLRLFGKVNGNFVRCCHEGHEVVMKILDLLDPADVKLIREILEDYDGLAIGPSNEKKKAAWDATTRLGRGNSTR